MRAIDFSHKITPRKVMFAKITKIFEALPPGEMQPIGFQKLSSPM
jgi:hypothetical protein